MKFKCKDPECDRGQEIDVYRLTRFVNSEGRTVFKCPYCREKVDIIPERIFEDTEEYLSPEECKDGYLYLIQARNSLIGIYNEKDKSFTISRVKFTNNYLFDEYLWGNGPKMGDMDFGTVKPFIELEKAPEFEKDEDRLAWLNTKKVQYRLDVEKL